MSSPPKVTNKTQKEGKKEMEETRVELTGKPKGRYNQFVTTLDMAQLKKIAAGLRRIDFDKPKSKYMKECDDFIHNEVPEIKSKVKMLWVNDVIDSRISNIAYFASCNWGLPKELSKEFNRHADYIEKLSNTWN